MQDRIMGEKRDHWHILSHRERLDLRVRDMNEDCLGQGTQAEGMADAGAWAKDSDPGCDCAGEAASVYAH